MNQKFISAIVAPGRFCEVAPDHEAEAREPRLDGGVRLVVEVGVLVRRQLHRAALRRGEGAEAHGALGGLPAREDADDAQLRARVGPRVQELLHLDADF